MAKSREKIQQLGFWDNEVSKPDHDTICLWAYQHAETIFRIVSPELFDHQWLINEVHLPYPENDAIRDQARKYAKANPRPAPRIIKKTIEYVLKSHTGQGKLLEKIVGYADLLLETEIPCIVPTYKANAKARGNDEFDGFAIGWSRRDDAPRILVEIKSSLPTVGELMRQINLYRTAFSGQFVVVSPDDSYAQLLEEQGVFFIKHEE